MTDLERRHAAARRNPPPYSVRQQLRERTLAEGRNLNMKPTISFHKEDETMFVNIRTYWCVSVPMSDGTYELRVKHQGPEEDTFAYYSLNRSERDDIELVSPDEFERRAFQIHLHEGQEVAEARETLFAQNVRVMTPSQADIIHELRRHWDAFVLLFNPSINTF